MNLKLGFRAKITKNKNNNHNNNNNNNFFGFFEGQNLTQMCKCIYLGAAL